MFDSLILFIPFLLIILFVIAVLFLFRKKYVWSTCLLLIAFFINYITETFAVNVFPSVNNDTHQISVMTFNVHGSSKEYKANYPRIAQLVMMQDCDIVLLNEFEGYYNKCAYYLDSLLSTKYDYSTYIEGIPQDNVFYSKYPIRLSDKKGSTYDKEQKPIYIIDFEGICINLIPIHLRSNNYYDSDKPLNVSKIQSIKDVHKYWLALNRGYKERRSQADAIVSDLINNSNLFILGDFNDVGGSYAIRKMKNLGLQDAWWKGGFGLGGTRSVLDIPFRIDHILYGKCFELIDVNVVETDGLSDHNALMARFKIVE